ncbi:hypothetical protein TNCV_3044411 [Trichonephila clavipes]|nr:hypothetical protein TNCV_3044411 [Trichonephila clavipes]
MKRRAESHSVPDDLMLELFQQHLPTRVQSILAAISPLTLEKVAELADRVMEVTPIAVSLRRIFQWTFLVGNVSTPIIGADFLYNFRLVPDISKQALLDSETNIKCHCILGNSRIHSIKTVSGDSVYHELLRKFPDITKPPRPDQEIKHSVVHYIETNSRPVSAKARRLAPDRLRIAKAEFENMITLGISSNSINPDDVHKSAIITPFGLFESTRMQFGLCNAAATFQRFIDEVLRNLPFVFAFVDDILVASSSPEEHLQHLQILFTRLQQYGLSFKAL